MGNVKKTAFVCSTKLLMLCKKYSPSIIETYNAE